MKKSTLDVNKIYTDISELQQIGSCRRPCTFICSICKKTKTMALDRLLKRPQLICGLCAREITNIERFGGTTPYASEDVRKKGRETCLKNNGVEYGGQTKKSREAASKTFSSPEIIEKRKKTFLSKYGVENYSQTPEGRKRLSDRFKDEEFVKRRTEATKKTKRERYNDENYSNLEKQKQTCLKKYNSISSLSSPEVRSKIRATLLSKYGVENSGQIPGHRSSIKYRLDGFYFDSSWELGYYIYLKEHNYNFIVHPNINITYEYNGKEHIYQPDFQVGDDLVEIKGDHFFENGKMICPFDRSKDGLYEAKHQCMIRNNVIIIMYDKLKELKIL